MIFYFILTFVCVTQTSLVMENLNAPRIKYTSLFAEIFAECFKKEPVIYYFFNIFFLHN